MQFLNVVKWFSANVFADNKQNIFAGKFVKEDFWLCYGRIFLAMVSELRFVKLMRFFEQNLLNE